MDAKAAVRDAVLSRRAQRPAADRDAAGAALAGALEELVRRARKVAAYASVGGEPPTDALLAMRPDVLLPVLLDDGDLDWATGALRAARRRLLEPSGPRLGVDALASCDLVVVPALAVDRRGRRLGRGGGSYDRALRRATGLTVALLYDDELVEEVPSEPHDVPVAAAVTPSYGLVRF
jgi:5-formyltetrahydrofolate cyclo-ligase